MEVKLWSNNREREMYEELFAIIKATEKLEKAYVGDIIAPADYESEFQKLIAHFKTLSCTLKDDTPTPSIKHLSDGLSSCPVSPCVEHRAADVVAECVQNFITSMDSLKLNMVAVVDELQFHPLLSDLSASLNKLPYRTYAIIPST